MANCFCYVSHGAPQSSTASSLLASSVAFETAANAIIIVVSMDPMLARMVSIM